MDSEYPEPLISDPHARAICTECSFSTLGFTNSKMVWQATAKARNHAGETDHTLRVVEFDEEKEEVSEYIVEDAEA